MSGSRLTSLRDLYFQPFRILLCIPECQNQYLFFDWLILVIKGNSFVNYGFIYICALTNVLSYSWVKFND